jgi:HEAT repeat protein
MLTERVRQYAEEKDDERMNQMMSLLAPVVKDMSLHRLRAMELVQILARYESAADAALAVAGQALLNDPSPRIRATAIAILQGTRRPDAAAFLKEAVLDERNTAMIPHRDVSVRHRAIEALGRLGSDASTALQELKSSDMIGRETRAEVIMALAQTGDAEIIPELLDIIETGPEDEMRAAVEGLGLGYGHFTEGFTVIKDMFHKGLTHPNVSRRQITCTAMKHTGNFYLIPALEPLLNDPDVRAYATRAIKRLQNVMRQYCQSEGIPENVLDIPPDELVNHLREEEWAAHAVRLRCRMDDDKTRREMYDKLADIVLKDEMVPRGQPSARVRAVTILSQQEEHRDDAADALVKVLRNAESPFTKEHCYRALGSLGGPTAIQVLKEAILAGPARDRNHRRFEDEAYQNLFQYLEYCGPEAALVLLQIGEERSKTDKEKRLLNVQTTKDEQIVPYLLEKARKAREAGNDKKLRYALRAACVESESYTPATRRLIADTLEQHLDHPSWEVRRTAAWGLGKTGYLSHIPLLRAAALQEPERRARQPFVRAIKTIRDRIPE